MARRSWVIRQLAAKYPATPVLLVDSGNFSDNPTPVGDAKTKALVEGMGRLGYAAANLGERDLRAGFDTFARRVGDVAFPILSCNIVRAGEGSPVWPGHALVEASSPDGEHMVRVGLIGAARFNPIFRKPGPDGSQLQIVHPAERVRAEIEKLRARGAELIVLLAAMHRDDARRLARSVEGIDAIVGSYGGLFAADRDAESGTWLFYAGNQGKRLGEARLRLQDGGLSETTTHHFHFLTKVYPADPEMLQFVGSAQVAPGRPPARAQATAAGERSSLTGSTACRECHGEVYTEWAASPHAQAFATLVRKNEQGNPACVACHATGAGRAGGFESQQATPEMARVGCESCHGDGAGHVARPEEPYGAISVESCIGCHDMDNSPDFDYYSYRSRVAHRDRRPR